MTPSSDAGSSPLEHGVNSTHPNDYYQPQTGCMARIQRRLSQPPSSSSPSPLPATAPSPASSSLSQTIFNTSNLIMGISLLTLSFAFKLSGWICGISLIFIFGFTASSTAKILARCQRHHLLTTGRPLLTYGDIGEAAFGYRGRWFIQIIFTIELFAATVAMLLLVFQTVGDLIKPLGVDQTPVRLLIWSLLTTLTWPKSLSVLSYGSLLGVLCLVNLVVAVIFDGTFKQQSPGSLWDPMPTSFWPEDPISLARSTGMFMAGFAGHACFPGFYASMARPRRFPVAINFSFSLATVLYLVVGAAGYLMFGKSLTHGLIVRYLDSVDYPRAIYLTTCILLAANPATKYPLTIYPIVLDVERFIFNRFKITAVTTVRNESSAAWDYGAILRRQSVQRVLLRTMVSALVLACAFWIHQFDMVIGLLGSLFATTTSVVFPLLCYLAMAQPSTSEYSLLNDGVEGGGSVDVEALVGDDDRQETKRLLAVEIIEEKNGKDDDDNNNNYDNEGKDLCDMENQPLLGGGTARMKPAEKSSSSELIILSGFERAFIWLMIVVFASIGIMGTVVSFLNQQ